MSDYKRPNNYHTDDIDDFFAQFDQNAQANSQNQSRNNAHRSTGRRNDNSSSARPQARQSSYRSQADRDAAKAQRKAIANNQPGARREAQRNNTPVRNQRPVEDRRVKPSRPAEAVHEAPTPAKRRPSANPQPRSKSAKSNKMNKMKQNLDANFQNIKNMHVPDTPQKIIAGIQAGGSGNGPYKRQSTKVSLGKFIVTLGLAVCMAVGMYVGVSMVTAPAINTDDIYAQLSQRSCLYDDQGNEIDNLYYEDGNRTILSYKKDDPNSEIPQDMANAVVSIEDKKFWKHNGFNFIRMVGAIKDKFVGGGRISGTSTITQQLARNVYLADIKSQRSLGRKLTEMYITIVLEKNLTKEQIMEAYLNSIYLGFNSYGIQAASQSYFSKDAKDLTTAECAALAALPQSPDSYALVKTVYNGSTSNPTNLPKIKTTNDATYYYNGDLSETRRNAVIKNMAAAGYITEDQKNKCLETNYRKLIHLGTAVDGSNSSYFTDYVINEVCQDMINEYGISMSEAKEKVYTTGLKIYTTMDSNIQDIAEEEFEKDSNYSGVAYVRKNSEGDLIGKDGSVQLHSYNKYFNDKDEFVLAKDEYKSNDDGGITILAGKRLALYDTKVNGETDISIEFKGMYTQENGSFYFIENGALTIPQNYKSSDSNGNCVVSGQFFTDYPNYFKKTDEGLVVEKGNYSIKQKVRQPQAAIVVMENETGHIKAMMGGRGATGKQLFNRATSTRQPGSNIKPIGVYGPALQMSYEYNASNKDMTLDTSDGSDWGDFITAGSIIQDEPMEYGGKKWPKNWYSGFRGPMTLRKSVEQSVNVNAVKTYLQIGADYSSSMLKKVGITSLDEEGEVNDLNPAALALGGMTNGISPLEMTAAYAVFPNGGVYREPISYTKIVNPNGQLLFEKKAKEEQVYDEGVAWIMTDILRTVVTQGLGGAAKISSQPVGGKTGTTSDSYDLWFTGFTPQYTAAMWMGNDLNIQLSAGSSQSARFWAAIMGRACQDLPRGSFRDMPENVERRGGEYFIKGTYSVVKAIKTKDSSETETSETTVPITTITNTSDPAPTDPDPTDPPPPPTDPPTTPPTEAPTASE